MQFKREGKVIPFPPKMRNQSLERKLAIERQSATALLWVRLMVQVDQDIIRDAERLGLTEAEFKPRVYREMQKLGKLS
jgi:hypothetical protein